MIELLDGNEVLDGVRLIEDADDLSPVNTEPLPWQTDEDFVIVPVLRGFNQIATLHQRYNSIATFAGGYVRWMASPRLEPVPAGDLDIFPFDARSEALIISDLQENGLKIKNESEVATSFWQVEDRSLLSSNFFAGTPAIQVVKAENKGAIVAKGSPREIISNFDFTVVRASLVSHTHALVDAKFYEHEMALKLALRTIHCPVSAVVRIAKYAKKGYRIDLAEILKLYADWDKRSPTYKEDLITAVGIMLDPEKRAELSPEDIAKYRHLIYID